MRNISNQESIGLVVVDESKAGKLSLPERKAGTAPALLLSDPPPHFASRPDRSAESHACSVIVTAPVRTQGLSPELCISSVNRLGRASQ